MLIPLLRTPTRVGRRHLPTRHSRCDTRGMSSWWTGSENSRLNTFWNASFADCVRSNEIFPELPARQVIQVTPTWQLMANFRSMCHLQDTRACYRLTKPKPANIVTMSASESLKVCEIPHISFTPEDWKVMFCWRQQQMKVDSSRPAGQREQEQTGGIRV